MAKYSHQPLPKYGDFGAPIKTNQPDNLKRQGGFPNGASPPGSVLHLDATSHLTLDTNILIPLDFYFTLDTNILIPLDFYFTLDT